MTANTHQRRSVNEWLAMLEQVEGAIARSIASTDGADIGDDAVEATNTRPLTTRIDRRIRKLAERVAAAERSAEEVGLELARAEGELRQWLLQFQHVGERLKRVA